MIEDRLAVLIDAENVSYANIMELLDEIAKIGTMTIKRIYADWTKPTAIGWKNALLENAITPIQQYSYTAGKNSSDSALIIDAMDILYAGKVHGFCIVSSDSDFTRLAIRLREAGMKVYGFGEKKTPNPFITACDKFIYTEILKSEASAEIEYPACSNDKAKPIQAPLRQVDPEIVTLITESVVDIADEGGWANLGHLGNHLSKKKTDFGPRNYGFSKLVLLIKSLDLFEIEEKESGANKTKNIYLKLKEVPPTE